MSVCAFQMGDVRLVHLYAEPKVSAETILSRIDLGLEGTQEMSKAVVFGDFNVDGSEERCRALWLCIESSLRMRGLRQSVEDTDHTFCGQQGMSSSTTSYTQEKM